MCVLTFQVNEPDSVYKMSSTNYATTGSAFGSWSGSGSASSSFTYQMGICDDSGLSPALWFSSNSACWKECSGWCNDHSATYYRTPTSGFAGSAFGENGHSNLAVKVVSVGIRYIPPGTALGFFTHSFPF